MDHLSKARRVIGIEADELRRLAENLDGQAFSRAIETLKTCVDHRGKIVVCGVGKSGHIGDKIAATLTSTNKAKFKTNCISVLWFWLF